MLPARRPARHSGRGLPIDSIRRRAIMKNVIGKRYALVLTKYVARFKDVPPSILTEREATILMIDALKRDSPIVFRDQPSVFTSRA